MPTDVAFLSDGSFVVSDGYGNSRVVKFSADGRHVASWGRPGTGPVEFHTPHSVAVDDDDRIYVADRENDRVQVLDADGVRKIHAYVIQRAQAERARLATEAQTAPTAGPSP